MATTRITVNRNGSLRVEGDFELVDPDGRPYDVGGRTKISLCRCGQSAKRPICDGSHKTCGFEEEAVARELYPPA